MTWKEIIYPSPKLQELYRLTLCVCWAITLLGAWRVINYHPALLALLPALFLYQFSSYFTKAGTIAAGKRQRLVMALEFNDAVLTGVFLHLGISSIDKTEMYQRTLLFFQDARDVSKSSSWMKAVDIGRTKLFTAIQLALLSAMWWIKGTPLGVFFPVLIGLLAPVRIALEKMGIFSNAELDALDGEIS